LINNIESAEENKNSKDIRDSNEKASEIYNIFQEYDLSLHSVSLDEEDEEGVDTMVGNKIKQ
jgi:Na+/phosphate symporter